MLSFISLIGEGQKVRFTVRTVFSFLFLIAYKYFLNPFIYLFRKRGQVKLVIQTYAIRSFPMVFLNYLLTKMLQENTIDFDSQKETNSVLTHFVRRSGACDVYPRIIF